MLSAEEMHWTPAEEADVRAHGTVAALTWLAEDATLPILLLRLDEWCRTVHRAPADLVKELVESFLADEWIPARQFYERHQGGHHACPCRDCLGFEFDEESLTFTPYEPDQQ